MLMSTNKQQLLKCYVVLLRKKKEKRHNVWFSKVSITFTVVLPGNQEGKIENELLSGRADGETDPFIMNSLLPFSLCDFSHANMSEMPSYSWESH